jgi:hypothetical protein
MTVNPVELIGGLATNSNVSKTDIIAWAKGRVPQVLFDADEIRNTTLVNQAVILLHSNGRTYLLDNADTTTADDGLNCIISSDGKRFKPFGTAGTIVFTSNDLSVMAPTTSAQLRGVITDETGTGALVFADSPALAGNPTATTASMSDNSERIATTEYVDRQAVVGTAGVGSFNARLGIVTPQLGDYPANLIGFTGPGAHSVATTIADRERNAPINFVTDYAADNTARLTSTRSS